MKKIDITKIRPVFGKADPHVLDPARFPKIIVPYENQMKKSFADASNQMISALTQQMVAYKKMKK